MNKRLLLLNLLAISLSLLITQLTFAQSTEATKTTSKKQVNANSIHSGKNTLKATKPVGLKNFSIKETLVDLPTEIHISSLLLCGGGTTIEMSAECQSGMVKWSYTEASEIHSEYNSPLILTPTVSLTYYVSCEEEGVESDQVKVGEVIVITAPTDVQADNAYVCSGDDVSLTANCASGTIFWYDRDEGGNFVGEGSPLIQNPTSTTAYFATCTDNTCETARIATNIIEVSATSTNEPSNVQVDKPNVCANTTVTLTATCATGAPIWYNQILGGSTIGTGNTLTQNPITNTPYSAACSGEPCPSNRVATEEVVIIPVEEFGSASVEAEIPGELCAGTPIKLIANCEFGGTPTWYITSDPNPIGIGDTLVHKVTIERNQYSVACLQGACNYYGTGVVKVDLAGMVSEGPPPPSDVYASNESICAGTSITLTANCLAGTIIWYTQAFEGSPIGTGYGFMHRPTVSTTYYALCKDYTVNCEIESLRTPTERVEVLSSSASMPTEVSVDKTYVLAGTEVILTANCANGDPIWYDQEFDGSPIGYGTTLTQNPTVSTTYYAACPGDPCETLRVTTGIVTIIPEPAEVRVNTTSICVEGSVSLTATCAVGTIEWYNQASDGEPIGTGSPLLVSINESTTYYAACESGGFSGNRIATATVMVYQIPEVTTNPLVDKTAIISGAFVTLTATCNIGDVVWYNQISGGAAIGNGASLKYYPDSTTTYYASCKNGNCESGRTATNQVVVTPTPINPTSVSVSKAAICSGTSVTLNAICTSGTIIWYIQASGGTPIGTGTALSQSPVSNTTYYALCKNDNCESSRVATSQVTVTTQAVEPISVSVNNVAICSGTTVSLSANCSIGTVNWYTSTTGGTAIGTGAGFSHSPTITTPYYAACENGICASTRSATQEVVVTQTPASPSAVIVSNNNVCSGTSVSLSASCATGTLKWYKQSTGGTSVGTSSPLSQVVSATGYFYAACENGACTSTRVITSQVVVVATPASPTLTANKLAICQGDSATLTGQCSSITDVFRWSSSQLRVNALTGLSYNRTRNVKTPGVYKAICEAANGCVSEEKSITVTQGLNCGTQIFIIITPDKPVICPGASITLNASGCTGVISWLGGTSTKTGTSATLNPTVTTTYTAQCSTGG